MSIFAALKSALLAYTSDTIRRRYTSYSVSMNMSEWHRVSDLIVTHPDLFDLDTCYHTGNTVTVEIDCKSHKAIRLIEDTLKLKNHREQLCDYTPS